MSKQLNQSSEGKYTHLAIEDRAKIEYGLNHKHSIRAISKELGKSPSTITREIQRNSTYTKGIGNDCIYINECDIHHICGNLSCNALCKKRCSKTCAKWCASYESGSCHRLLESPHVCNACPKLSARQCNRNQVVYRARDAHNKYRELLVERRAGFDLTLGELVDLDETVSPLIKKGQSPYHIVQTNDIPVSLSTLYRIVASEELDARDIDLKQKVRRKERKSNRHGTKISDQIRMAKVGHMYGDFLKYMAEHDTFHVEMDCVIGKQTEPAALLTLHYPNLMMQLAIYLEFHTSACVVDALDTIEQVLGAELFVETFPVILTDNGAEFSDVESIERSFFNRKKQRTKLFFCEPNRSDEKGSCENNHRLIREVIPKGTSLTAYNQADITLMMNHINSYCRKKLFGKCAYDLAMDVFPEEFFDLLGLYKIEPEEVTLKPSLLKR